MDSDWTFSPKDPSNANTPGSTALQLPSAMKTLPTVSPNNQVLSEEHFLLHQLDHPLYEHRQHEHMPAEFDLDGIDFIVPDDLGANSKAYPPLSYPQNTPMMGPRRGAAPLHLQLLLLLLMAFQLPILPGQNEKSFNQEHLFHKQRQQRSRQGTAPPAVQRTPLHQPQHVRPDAVFTPLVSPAVTPHEQQVNLNTQLYAPVHADFEPLTSPALKAQGARDVDRRRSLSTFGPDDHEGSSAKRRTPHLTPNLQAHPSAKTKRSPSLRKVPQHLLDLLPDSSYEQGINSSETTPMLPPQGKRMVIDGTSSASTPVGPGTLMGFTMNRLAEQQSSSSNGTSPLLLPQGKLRKYSNSSLRSDLHGSGRTSMKMESSLSETSPVLEAQNGEGYGGKRENATKKASHKLAEQGRRNRMNQAVHELSRLIPTGYHERVSIPSKATTVELAASYIRDLQKEMENMKQRLRDR